ncbi:MAG: hypothetical protein KDD99_28305, partial [Bacteroidetes bacterium]|nr:hypothetical protein [Bacteroidota bacterium]
DQDGYIGHSAEIVIFSKVRYNIIVEAVGYPAFPACMTFHNEIVSHPEYKINFHNRYLMTD